RDSPQQEITHSLIVDRLSLTGVQADLVLTQPPYLIGKTGQALRLTCESSGLDTTVAHMSWYRQLPGKQQENLLEYEGSSIKSFGSGFENRVIVIREDSQNIFDLIIKCPTVHDTSTYYCQIKTHDYVGRGTVLTVTDVMYTKQPSVYLLLPSAEEMAAQQFVTLTCLVKDFAPKEIFVQWTVNDQLIDANKYRNTEVMADSENLNYSMYSMLTISADEWNRRPSYSCVVGHEMFPLKTRTRTVNKSSGKPSFVNLALVLMDTVNPCH
uniref:Ig-like domain-containing protein n=1 Tax=Callorhinchus milii TaxID=7868 RepID=A0A4W3GC99_CALMI